MRKLILFLFSSHLTLMSFSQQLSTQNLQLLRDQEKEMIPVTEKIIDEKEAENRIIQDSIFTRMLVKALKTPYSFHYPFDSLYTVSRIYAPDSSFRIITWQLEITSNSFRKHGAIQMNTADGQLKLFPLVDRSDMVVHDADTIADNVWWIGAVYYNIIKKEFKGKPVYTLLGYDEHSILSNRKIIEILDFSEGKPVFGKRIFTSGTYSRFLMEYKKAAGARLNYDPETDMIVAERLVSESNEPRKKYTLVGSADYDAFKWENGMWVYKANFLSSTPASAEIPVPAPVTESKFDFSEKPEEKPKNKKEKKQ